MAAVRHLLAQSVLQRQRGDEEGGGAGAEDGEAEAGAGDAGDAGGAHGPSLRDVGQELFVLFWDEAEKEKEEEEETSLRSSIS